MRRDPYERRRRRLDHDDEVLRLGCALVLVTLVMVLLAAWPWLDELGAGELRRETEEQLR